MIEPVFQQFSSVSPLIPSTENRYDQGHAVSRHRSDKTLLRRISVPGLATDGALKIPQQPVVISNRDAPGDGPLPDYRVGTHRADLGLDDLAKDRISHRISEKNREIPSGGIMIRSGEPVGIGEITVQSTDVVGLLRHKFGITFHRTRYTLG